VIGNHQVGCSSLSWGAKQIHDLGSQLVPFFLPVSLHCRFHCPFAPPLGAPVRAVASFEASYAPEEIAAQAPSI